MTRWRVIGGTLGIVVLLGVAGCASAIRGVAEAVPGAKASSSSPRSSAVSQGPINAGTAFGKASTVDPCSIVDVTSVHGVSSARRVTADALDDCPVFVTQKNGATAYVTVGPLETSDDMTGAPVDDVTTLPDGMIVQVGKPDAGDYCDAYVIFPDGFDLHVAANPSTADSHANVCASAVAMAENAGDRIDAGAIRHRTYPRGSVGEVDPCGLIGADALAAAGVSGISTFAYPEGHECYWASGSDISLPTAQLDFVVGAKPTILDPSTDSSAVIAGRASVISLYTQPDTDSICWINTGLNAYTDGRTGSSGGLVEIAEIGVDTVKGSKVNPCTAAKAVATAIWPKLPALTH
ncbi:MAG TPA: hypothetical protein VHV49_15195 [Pseudonocardiaceae bacterium]|jgi:hypothetical protein|nr:hypothetical protein [Pseudonocardiaceae bacterium]